jgi:phosphosulfolactate synthase (CoM biosynthesis protein A)
MHRAFPSIPIVTRSEKPRPGGITMIIDYGMGMCQQEDLLTVVGSYIDLAKIRVGSGALYESSLLRSKIALYERNQVTVFPGARNLGKEVNIGNVAPEEVLQLEGLRRNLDSNMDLKEVPKSS